MLALACHSVIDTTAFADSQISGLYVHIPFCFHKCHYCDFYSITRQTPERMGRFVDLVLFQGERWAIRHPHWNPRTVFFGGGTPSLLPMLQMEKLVRGLGYRFGMSEVDEWTVECNPATLTAEYCRMLRELGVNRLSFGAQSFDRQQLKVLERHHDPEDVPRSIEMARAAGFERLNIDLIYAIPGQTLESWMASLEQAVSLGLSHLSCYGLTYEPNTPIAVRSVSGQINAVEESLELQMLHARLRTRLRATGTTPLRDQQLRHCGPGMPAQSGLLERRELSRPWSVGGITYRRDAWLEEPAASGRVGIGPGNRQSGLAT